MQFLEPIRIWLSCQEVAQMMVDLQPSMQAEEPRWRLIVCFEAGPKCLTPLDIFKRTTGQQGIVTKWFLYRNPRGQNHHTVTT